MFNIKISQEENHFGITDFDFWFHRRPINEIKAIIEAAAKFMAELGIHWDRVHLPGIFSWNVVEYIKGKYDWTITDALVNIAQKYEINLAPNIWPYAAWDQEAYQRNPKITAIDRGLGSGAQVEVDSKFPIPKRYGIPHNINAYKDWLTALVERYNGDGINDMPGLKVPIKYWEIAGGYRAIVPFFFFGKPTEFTTLLKSSYESIKKADQNSKIINAGPASISKILDNPKMDLNKDEELIFFEDTLKLGCGDYFDILSIITNGFEKDLALRLINYYKKILSKYGYEKPLWISEIASHCEQGNFMGYILPHKSLEEQAANLVKQFVIAFSSGIKKAFWTALGPAIPKDFILSEPLESIGYIDMVSLLNGEGKERPSFYTFKLLISLIDTFKNAEFVDIEKGVEAYRFDIGGKKIYILWSELKKKIIFNELKGKKVTIINSVPKMSGGKVLLQSKGEAFFNKKVLNNNEEPIIELDNFPIFIKE